jgi:hypothetical protein
MLLWFVRDGRGCIRERDAISSAECTASSYLKIHARADVMAVVDEQTDEATKKKILGLDVLEQRQ